MNSILEALKEEYGINKLPSSIVFKEHNDVVEIIMDVGFIKKNNMQVTGNAFEGWAVAIRAVINKTIRMDLIWNKKEDIYFDENNSNPHFNRFLYRALKFSEQYEWFELSDSLKNDVERFKDFLYKSGNIFTNNVPTKDNKNEDIESLDENYVEKELSKDGILDSIIRDSVVGKNKVYRQLPVGLFKGEKAKANAIFTHGHSAVDLWNINGDTMNIVELKTNNRMIGIVTEIFFYSNYMYDFLVENNSFELGDYEKDVRGYKEIVEKKGEIKKIKGILLADKGNYYPCVTDKVVDVLNGNQNVNISYVKREYRINRVDINISAV